MKRSYFLSVLLMLVSLLSSVQAQQTNHWYFGSAAGHPNTGIHIDFTSGSPVVSSCIPLLTMEGSSSISDDSGNPLFYTDGTDIWDASTNTDFSSFNLGGSSSSTQAAIVMPRPGFTNQWLVFTTGEEGLGVSYNIVQRVAGVFSMVNGAPISLITAAAGATEGIYIVGSTKAGTDFWVIHRLSGSGGNVRAIEILSTGNTGATVNSTLSGAGFTNTNYTTKQGIIKSNTCQNKLAFTYLNGDVDLVDFDASTGQVVAGTARKITVPTVPLDNNGSYGIEFSPNDQYLYITNLNGKNIYRHNIAANTTTLIGTVTSGEAGELQLGPNGVIYMARMIGSTSQYLGAISSPNTGGTFSETAVSLAGATCGPYTGFSYRGLPTFPRSLVVSSLSVSASTLAVCTGSNVTFNYTFGGAEHTVTPRSWSVSPGTGWSYVSATSSTSVSPVIQFTTPGTYRVTLTVTDICSRNYTDYVDVVVSNPLVPAGTVNCSGVNIILDNPASDPNEPNYIWYANSVATGNIIGTGTPVTYAVGNDASKPTQICVAVGSSASTTTTTGRSIASGASLTGASELTPKVSSTFNVLADILVLKSFDVAFRFAGTYTFTITIRNGSAATVFTQSYTTGAVGACSSGAVYTVNVNTSLPAGTGYTITLSSASTIELGRGAWAGATNAGEITYNAPAPGTNSFVNLQYDVKDFNVVTTCSTPQCYPVSCTLPVEWSSFSVRRSGNSSAVLNWTTLSEINNDRFVIERSVNGTDFYTIGTVAGKGTYVGATEYEFIDENAPATIAYYRIKQVDIDGQDSYSAVKSIEALDGALAVVYPNPSASSFTLQSSSEQSLTLTVYDVLGRVVYSSTTSETTTIFGADLTKGTYILKIQSAGSVQTIKIEKQ